MRDADLRNSLRRLAETLPRDASPATGQRVLAAFRTGPRRRLRASAFSLAAASLLLAFASFWAFHFRPKPPAPANADANANAGFIALPYAQSDVPLEQALIVRVTLLPSEWETLGVPVLPARASPVRADLLVGQDGVPRAVRLVSVQ